LPTSIFILFLSLLPSVFFFFFSLSPFQDPKKHLRSYMEREGGDMDFEVEETGPGHARVYCARLRLPATSESGEPLVAEAAVQGKRKLAIAQCALAACRMLHARGLLRPPPGGGEGGGGGEEEDGPRRRQRRRSDEDDDADDFFDRTGAVQRKRQRREVEVLTHESVLAQQAEMEQRLAQIQAEVAELQQKEDDPDAADAVDSLDAFMSDVMHSEKAGQCAKLQSEAADIENRLTHVRALARKLAPSLAPLAKPPADQQSPAAETASTSAAAAASTLSAPSDRKPTGEVSTASAAPPKAAKGAAPAPAATPHPSVLQAAARPAAAAVPFDDGMPEKDDDDEPEPAAPVVKVG
jgi:hypothetical protein